MFDANSDEGKIITTLFFSGLISVSTALPISIKAGGESLDVSSLYLRSAPFSFCHVAVPGLLLVRTRAVSSKNLQRAQVSAPYNTLNNFLIHGARPHEKPCSREISYFSHISL